jgi:hypothetical protein
MGEIRRPLASIASPKFGALYFPAHSGIHYRGRENCRPRPGTADNQARAEPANPR